MPTANEDFLNALIRHQVGLMRVVPSIARDINKLLLATEADLVAQVRRRLGRGATPTRLQALVKAIAALRGPAWKDATESLKLDMIEIAQMEPGFLDGPLKTASPAILETTLPTAGQLSALVRTQPFQGRTLAAWANKIAADDIARLQSAVQIGVTQGQPTEEIARRLVGTARLRGANGITQISRNNANALARTAVNAIANQSKRAYYEENADIFSGELYVATLDGRTTLICMGLDGKRFPIGKGPIPPVHFQCRSLRVATIDGIVVGKRPAKAVTRKQTLREFSAQRGLKGIGKRDDLPRGTKQDFDKFESRRMRELTGRVPSRTDYDTFLRAQSSEFQDDVLGPSRAALFRSGKVRLDKFTNRTGDTFTLKELKAQL